MCVWQNGRQTADAFLLVYWEACVAGSPGICVCVCVASASSLCVSVRFTLQSKVCVGDMWNILYAAGYF